MPVVLLMHVDIPSQFRSEFEQAGFVLRPAIRENDQSPILPEGAGDPADVRAVLTIGSIGLRSADMDALPNLRMICCQDVGFEKIDLAAAKARGIMVTNGSGTNDTAVADHAVALLASVVRDVARLDRAVRRGEWQSLRQSRPQLTGKRLGVLGLGNIGLKVAERCSAGFGMQVSYHNRQARSGSPWPYYATLIGLAGWADFLVVAVPGGARTRHLIDGDVLAALGPEGFLVNVSRGSVVDTDALIAALQQRRIAGAGLDVLEGEPAVPQPLRSLDNVILTPHVAGRSPEALAAMFGQVLENLTRHFAGRPVLTPVPGMER
ncbi:2-hydroxyacid dehydrogenase [Martelella alba]|uniref:2-hydroxyacid dehydrogenase n=1 Tax=Martelella alba TaxID=2590451 RepID=A0ABY2SPD2_9HYPH|nr:2-hydroxyacid dehydrogenase [Martelella alba]TKI07730.1 2-hydroxyacid dehydrogenase [Martelella alba]